jgi:hypothetical protein
MIKPMTKEQLDAAECPESPTGAHHWLLESKLRYPKGTCKYCGETREFIGSWEDHERFRLPGCKPKEIT